MSDMRERGIELPYTKYDAAVDGNNELSGCRWAE